MLLFASTHLLYICSNCGWSLGHHELSRCIRSNTSHLRETERKHALARKHNEEKGSISFVYETSGPMETPRIVYTRCPCVQQVPNTGVHGVDAELAWWRQDRSCLQTCATRFRLKCTVLPSHLYVSPITGNGSHDVQYPNATKTLTYAYLSSMVPPSTETQTERRVSHQKASFQKRICWKHGFHWVLNYYQIGSDEGKLSMVGNVENRSQQFLCHPCPSPIPTAALAPSTVRTFPLQRLRERKASIPGLLSRCAPSETQ